MRLQKHAKYTFNKVISVLNMTHVQYAKCSMSWQRCPRDWMIRNNILLDKMPAQAGNIKLWKQILESPIPVTWM